MLLNYNHNACICFVSLLLVFVCCFWVFFSFSVWIGALIFYLWCFFLQRIFVARLNVFETSVSLLNVISFNAKCVRKDYCFFFYLDWVHYSNVVKVMWYIFLYFFLYARKHLKRFLLVNFSFWKEVFRVMCLYSNLSFFLRV